jgi:hypothetical protein
LLIGVLALLPIPMGCHDNDEPGSDGTAYSATQRDHAVSSTVYDGTTSSGVQGRLVYIVAGRSVSNYTVNGAQPSSASDRFTVRRGDTVRWLDASGAVVVTIGV